MPEPEDWTNRDDCLYAWEITTRPRWQHGIFDNPNGPYLRSQFLGEGREIHAAVDPQTSEILRLADEVSTAAAAENARIREELLAGLTDWLAGSHPDSLPDSLRAEVGRSFRDLIDRICPAEKD